MTFDEPNKKLIKQYNYPITLYMQCTHINNVPVFVKNAPGFICIGGNDDIMGGMREGGGAPAGPEGGVRLAPP